MATNNAEDLEVLLADIDWSTVNHGALLSSTHTELEAITTAHIDTLISCTSKAQLLGSQLQRSLSETTQLCGLFEDYKSKLKSMGEEIAQIEQVSRGLRMQTVNQKKLLDLVAEIITKCSLDENHVVVLQRNQFDNIEKIKEASEALIKVQRVQFEDGLSGIKAVAERQGQLSRIREQFNMNLSLHLADTIRKHVPLKEFNLC